MSLATSFESQLRQAWPPARWQEVTVLVAVSGGADSVALLRGLTALREPTARGRLIVGHFNHGWRGEASDHDEHFVRALADRFELACHVGRATSHGPADEASARRARYDFLQTTAEQRGARYVVVAHTADDQAETVLHRIVRGTGLEGLAGMRRARALGPAVTLLRPLLRFRRDELRAYLAELAEHCCHDATNDDVRYTRARIRHDLLPQLATEFNPRVTEALVRLASQAAQAQEVVEQQVVALLERVAKISSSDEITIGCDALADVSSYLVRAMLKHVWREHGWPTGAMGAREWSRLSSLVRRPPAPPRRQRKIMLPGAIVAVRDERVLRLSGGHTATKVAG